MGRLSGKRIFLTGAAQGIGYAIAEACLREEAELFLVDRDASLLAESAARLGEVAHAAADIADAKAIDAAMSGAAKAIGPINTVINNAGMNVFSTPLEATEDEWTRNLDVNVKGAWHCARAALPGMIQQGGGVILNVASTHAFTIIPHTFPYPVAKHALIGLTKSLAIEYAGNNVRVNALAPGYVATQTVIDYWNSFDDPEAARAKTLALHPGGRIATPQEIAMAVLFLVSDECPFINAACLVADGGLSVLHHP